MTTFAQSSNGDLLVTAGKLTLVTDAATAGAQKLRNQFNLFLGEWYLDQRIGVPYFQAVFVKAPDLGLLQQLFRGIILNTPGILRVDSLTVAFNNGTRLATLTFAATWNDGTTISTTQLDAPFIVRVPTNTTVSS